MTLLSVTAPAQSGLSIDGLLNSAIRGAMNKWLKNEPITTSIRDVNKQVNLLDEFGNDQLFRPMHRRPRSAAGGYVLTPGFYELRCRSYCIRAGTHAPSNGDGYLYAPLLGRHADIVQTILTRSADHREIRQDQVQLLLWAIIARSDFRSMNSDMTRTATTLLKPAQVLRLNKQALIMTALNLVDSPQLTASMRAVFQAENEIRQAFSRVQLTFQDMERLAMLVGPAVIDNPDIRRGRWSNHPGGYYVRYYPSGYSQTIIQVYVPNDQLSVEFDAADDVAVPANTGAQRLALSNVPYDTTGYALEEPPVVIARQTNPAKEPIPTPAPTPQPVPVPTPAPIVTYRTVCGQVIDAQTSKAVTGATIRFADQTLTADAGGRFQLTGVLADQRIDLKAQAGGYQPAELIVLVDADKECQPVLIPMDLIPKPKPADSVVVHNTTLRAGERVVLDNIQFKQTKSDLLPPGQAELDTLTDWLRNRPSLRIELSGHTSNEGDYKANVKLSKERVSACKIYLVRKGIDARRITTVGYGPDRPIASNDKPETAARNRRVELRVVEL